MHLFKSLKVDVLANVTFIELVVELEETSFQEFSQKVFFLSYANHLRTDDQQGFNKSQDPNQVVIFKNCSLNLLAGVVFKLSNQVNEESFRFKHFYEVRVRSFFFPELDEMLDGQEILLALPRFVTDLVQFGQQMAQEEVGWVLFDVRVVVHRHDQDELADLRPHKDVSVQKPFVDEDVEQLRTIVDIFEQLRLCEYDPSQNLNADVHNLSVTLPDGFPLLVD